MSDIGKLGFESPLVLHKIGHELQDPYRSLRQRKSQSTLRSRLRKYRIYTVNRAFSW